MINEKVLFALAGASSGILWSVLGWARKPEVAFNWKLFGKEVTAHLILGFLGGLVAPSWEAAVLSASFGESALKLIPQYNNLAK